jgi:integrase
MAGSLANAGKIETNETKFAKQTTNNSSRNLDMRILRCSGSEIAFTNTISREFAALIYIINNERNIFAKIGWRNHQLLLSVKAGLRAGEIANLTWQMLVEPTGEIGTSLELQNRVAKKGSGRVIPVHPELHTALSWRA